MGRHDGPGIVAYGVYFPSRRISSDEYRRAWGSCAAAIKEKAVPDFDEDSLTMAVEASRRALLSGPRRDPGTAAVLALATTSAPYAEKALASTVVSSLGLPPDIVTVECTTSSRAGAEALELATMVLAEKRKPGAWGLVAAADAPRAAPHDPLEHGLGAGAVAIVLGWEDVLARLVGRCSWVEESLGERFRRAGQERLNDMGVREVTGSVFDRVAGAAVGGLLEASGLKPADYRYLVVPQHDGRAGLQLARRLGFKEEQVRPAFLFDRTGDVGVCSCLVGLAAVLDVAAPGERVILVAYGSGAAASALDLEVTAEAGAHRRPQVGPALDGGVPVDYLEYLKLRRML
ncbi:MAG: hydroxymethylglutaryl-CoA synthase [Acetobacteraceae bacterium]|nr:hydroxymethylglutaryl-CoA synthase [Acetobacteraceae bacterium]